MQVFVSKVSKYPISLSFGKQSTVKSIDRRHWFWIAVSRWKTSKVRNCVKSLLRMGGVWKVFKLQDSRAMQDLRSYCRWALLFYFNVLVLPRVHVLSHIVISFITDRKDLAKLGYNTFVSVHLCVSVGLLPSSLKKNWLSPIWGICLGVCNLGANADHLASQSIGF